MQPTKKIEREMKEGPKCKGVYTFTKAFLETKEQFALSKMIDEVRAAGGDFMTLVRQLNAMCRTEKWVVENIVPLVGRANVLDNMANPTPTSSMLIDEFAVGSDNTAVSDSDTALGAEEYRNPIASRTSVDDEAYFTGFLNATEWDGTIEEAGLFADDVLMSHVLVSTSKSDTETLTIDWTYTLSNA